MFDWGSSFALSVRDFFLCSVGWTENAGIAERDLFEYCSGAYTRGCMGGGLYQDTAAGKRLRASVNGVVCRHRLSGKDVAIRTNALGFRGGAIGPKSKRRLLFLGDSITFADYLAEGEIFVARVQEFSETALRPWETLNTGVGAVGIGDLHECLAHRRCKWLLIGKPQFVFASNCLRSWPPIFPAAPAIKIVLILVSVAPTKLVIGRNHTLIPTQEWRPGPLTVFSQRAGCGYDGHLESNQRGSPIRMGQSGSGALRFSYLHRFAIARDRTRAHGPTRRKARALPCV